MGWYGRHLCKIFWGWNVFKRRGITALFPNGCKCKPNVLRAYNEIWKSCHGFKWQKTKFLWIRAGCIGDYSINCCCFNLSYGRAHSSLQFRIGTCYILFFDSASSYWKKSSSWGSCKLWCFKSFTCRQQYGRFWNSI